MNRDEAKFILRSYGLDGQDQRDPQFADTLAMAQRDPELARWFAEEQAVDSRLARSFSTFPVPPDLKSQLLALRKVVVVPFWQRQPVWLAAAAVAVLLAIVVLPRFRRGDAAIAGNFPEEILRLAGKGPHATAMVANLAETQQWLTANHLPADLLLSESLKGLRFKGCRVVEWQHRRVAMICLFDGAQHLDLFVFEGSAPAAGEAPRFVRVDGLAAALWTRAGQTYLLAGHGVAEAETLKRYL